MSETKQVQLFCNKCNKDIEDCRCKDLAERFIRNFTGSVMEDRVVEKFRDKVSDRVVA